MSEQSLGLHNPQISAEDWQFIENDFEWFFTPITSDSMYEIPQWEGDGCQYSIYAGTSHDGAMMHNIIRWELDVSKGDIFQFCPQTKQVLVTKDFHADFPDYDYETRTPEAGDMVEIEKALGIMKAHYADFAAWEEEIAPPEQPKQPEQHIAIATPLTQYLGNVATFWDNWQQGTRKLWGL